MLKGARLGRHAVEQPDAADGAGLRQKLLRQGWQNSRNAPPLIWGVRPTERLRSGPDVLGCFSHGLAKCAMRGGRAGPKRVKDSSLETDLNRPARGLHCLTLACRSDAVGEVQAERARTSTPAHDRQAHQSTATLGFLGVLWRLTASHVLWIRSPDASVRRRTCSCRARSR